MFERNVLGLDIGSYSVKAAVLKAGLRGVEFVRFEELELQPGISVEEREATIQLFLDQKDLPRETVVVALPGSEVTQRHLRFPFSGSNRIAQAIPFEIEEEVPFPLESMILTHEDVETRPDQTDALVLLATRDRVREHLAGLHRMEIEPRYLEMEGAVLGNLSLYLKLDELSRIFLDIGHERTSVCMIAEGKPVALRPIPIAGRHITEAIAKDHNLDFQAAQRYKHDNGIFDVGSTQANTSSVRDVLDSLSREISRTLQATTGDPLDSIAPTEILLVGGSSRLDGIDAYLAERVGIHCTKMRVSRTDEGANLLDTAGLHVYAEAAALALRASNTDRVTKIDFRQGEFKYRPDLSGLRPQIRVASMMFGAMLLLWTLNLSVEWFVRSGEVEELEERLATIYQDTFPKAKKARDPLKAMETEVREIKELANHLGVTGTGLSALEILRQMSERIPPNFDVSFRELRIERKEARAKGHTNDLRTVDRIKEQLLQVSGFQDVRISDAVNNQKIGGKDFNLTIRFEDGT